MTGNVQRLRPFRVTLALVGLFLLTGCATTASRGRADSTEAQPPSTEQSLAAGDEAARRGDFERALAYYLRAVGAEPTVEGWIRIGAVSTRLGNSERALHAYLQVVTLEPNRADALEGAGLEHMALGDAAAAREHLARAVDIDPQRWRSHNALGILADQAEDHGSAIAHYETALDLNPRSPMLLNNLGYSRHLSGDLDQAARDFYAATQADPSYKPAWSNLALVYAHRGLYSEAVQTLLKIEDKPTAYNDIGYVAFQRGDLPESEMLLSEAVRLSPVYYETANKNLESVRARMRGQTDASPALGKPFPDLISGSLTAAGRDGS